MRGELFALECGAPFLRVCASFVVSSCSFPCLGTQKNVSVCAIRGANIASEAAQLAVLHAMTEANCPLAPVLVPSLQFA